MLWYKAWLETRWRFVIGIALLMVSAASAVWSYPQVVKLLPMVERLNTSDGIAREVQKAADLARSYRGYVWSQWFQQNMGQLWSLFAVLIGAGGLLSRSAGGGTLLTLSLPVSRRRLIGTRAATGLAELFVMAFVPSLLVPLLSPVIGQRYAIGDALVHAGCAFVAGSVFFSLAFLLSTVFSDVWRPWLIALCVVFGLSLIRFVPALGALNLISVMSAESYYRTGGLPWLGLLASAVLSMAFLYGAATNIARRDF
jgi:ABC-type transport system involved in multi-copper enzyme maturation permease subunit